MQFEKKYWSKGEFTDSKGSEFNGYVGIFDGEAYDYKTLDKLIGKDTYLARINCSKNNFDRTLSQQLKLPYGREDVVFAANDFLYAGVIKTAIERLQENNDYLFRNSIISSSNLPAASECVLLSSAIKSDGTLQEGAALGKYNFSSYALRDKTHEDRNFYPNSETRYNYYAKTKKGDKEEFTSSNTLYIQGERVPENKILDDKDSEESLKDFWKELYNEDNDLIITPTDRDDKGNIKELDQIELDAEGIIKKEEYLYYANIEDHINSSNKLVKKVYSYNLLNGKKSFVSIDTDKIYNLIIDHEILNNSSKFALKELSFIVKCNNIKSLGLTINEVVKLNEPNSYFNISDNYYHIFYELENLLELNDKTINIQFDYPKNAESLNEDIEILAEGLSSENIRFDCQFEFGEIEDSLQKYKIISNVVRTPLYRYVWCTNDSNSYKYAEQPTWTYKHLMESPEWIKALKENKNPRLLIYDDEVGTNFIPQDNMTAYDVYVMAGKQWNEYNYPQIYRKVEYEYKGEISNSKYKEKKYSVESYKFDLDENDEEIVDFGFKSAEDIDNDLSKENEKEKYDKIPSIIKEAYTVTTGEENLLFNFNEITSSEIVVHRVDSDNKLAELLVFLVSKTKILIFRTNYYFNNISEGTKNSGQNYIIDTADYENEEFLIKLSEDSKDAIYIENVDPHDKSSLRFLNLNAIKVYKNAMYLIDSKLDMVIRYDIEALLNDEEAKTDNWFKVESIKLVDIMQGFGDSTDKIYFNKPYSIDVSDDYAYIVDRNNNCIKEYTSSLNYIKTLKNGYFSSHDIQACAINPHSCIINGTEISAGSLWIASVLGTRIFISVLEKDIVKFYGQIEDISLIQDKDSWVEEIRNIKFSQNNSNYFYINTSKRIYKLHVSNPLYPFASLNYFKQRSIIGTMKWSAMRYPWHRIPSVYSAISKGNDTSINNELTWDYIPPTSSAEILDNKCFCLTSAPEIEGDIIFHFGVLYDDSKIKEFIRKNKKNYKNETMTFNDIPLGDLATMIKSSAMLLYQEPDSFVSTISNELIKIYEIYQIKETIENDYINSLTFNKMLHALVHNLVKIKNNLIGHFKAATNLDNVIVYDNVIMDEYFKNLKLKADEDYFVHNNEHLSIIVNKAFENIYDIQEKIMNRMQTEFMAAQSYVNNNARLI